MKKYRVTVERPDPEDVTKNITEKYIDYAESEDEAYEDAREQWPDAQVYVEEIVEGK